ncbi:MAG: Zn-ribbon domain-containing OB-fold protein [Halobacteriaceae archaeon]
MSDESRARDAGYDDFLDALEEDEGYFLRCENGHGWLPPRQVCPRCGSQGLTETSLPPTGEVVARTTVHVAAPQFVDDTPYVVAIVDTGAVRLTGQVRGVPPEDVDRGLTVTPTIVTSETSGDRLLGFEPVDL